MLKEKEIKKVIKPYGFTMINTYENYLNTNTVKCCLPTKNFHGFECNVNIERIIKDDDFGYSLSVSEIKFK